MASVGRGVWAIDIGNNSLKAIHLKTGGSKLQVTGFDYIEHGKILSGGGISDKERTELITASLHRFVEQNDIGKDEVAISVPGQMSFARFVKLPPVEPKEIPKMIQYEAVQQIPFDINEVEWDYQEMRKPDSPDVEVGIFAIKNEVISGVLDFFVRENLKVTAVQMAPMALYNFANYERGEVAENDKNAVIVLDMGAENTDLVISTKTSVWQRSIPLGGNAFTRAVAEAFKLDFEKAEKLKRTAPMSKYARQIFQSMKPVFSDLAAEIQRSLGFYSNSNRDIKFQKVMALGGGMKMQGLVKFLQQTLALPVIRPEAFDQLDIAASVSAAKFHENVADFGVVYGLAVQGLGVAKIESNLLPRRIARTISWSRKANYFTIAASVFLVVSLAALGRTMIDKSSYTSQQSTRDKVKEIVGRAQLAQGELDKEKARSSEYDSIIEKQVSLFKYREIIPLMNQSILKCLPNAQNNPAQANLYKAFDLGNAEEMKKVPRGERKQLFITRTAIRYSNNLAGEGFTETATSTASSSSSGGGGMGMGGPMGGMGGPMGGMGGPMGGMGGPMGGMGGPMGGGYSSPSSSSSSSTPGEPGFIVTIEGYTPYKNFMDLLAPAGVANNKSRWGIVTRLINLDTVCPNTPFKLFNPTKMEDFKLETGEVDFAKQIPLGIGIEHTRTFEVKSTTGNKGVNSRNSSERILIDPLTRETLNRVADVDERNIERKDNFGRVIYKVNDHWFRISAKFKWNKDGTATATEATEAVR